MSFNPGGSVINTDIRSFNSGSSIINPDVASFNPDTGIKTTGLRKTETGELFLIN
jgi:hypothetical protein